MSRPLDLTGKRFGRLVAIEFTGLRQNANRIWLCKCDCGKEVHVIATSLSRGATLSCGCRRADVTTKRNTTHGRSHMRSYNTWRAMMDRCYNRDNAWYDYYGGRGIDVCVRWHDFVNFLDDMGEAPKDLSLDRIDNNLGYSPSNCRWATQQQQLRNKRNNRLITHRGETKTITDWREDLGLGRGVIDWRLANGWTVAEALRKV